MAALRKSAPAAQIIVLIPFGQFSATALKQAVAARQQANPPDVKINLIDLGPGVARSLTPKDAKAQSFGGLHPNDRATANFAALLIPQVIAILNGKTQ